MALIKFGNISSVDAEKGTARVEFPEDGIVSFDLPILVTRSKDDKYFHAFDINEHVVCLMDEGCENGVVLGAIYDSKNKPENGVSKDVSRVKFSDGTKVEYDRGSSTLEVLIGSTKIKAAPDGLEISSGGESLKTILSDFLTQSSTETHSGSGSGPPNNAASYLEIITRLNNLFTG